MTPLKIRKKKEKRLFQICWDWKVSVGDWACTRVACDSKHGNCCWFDFEWKWKYICIVLIHSTAVSEPP